jgi:uncharacterized damage-inducible protein DinB
MRAAVMCVLCVAIAASGASAQAPAANAVSGAIKSAWDGAKKNIKDSAEQMPEADYTFKPVATVRSFGEVLAHVAGASYVFCSAAKREKSPFSEEHFEKAATSKAQIVKAVAGAMSYCVGVYAALTDAKAGQSIEMPFGMGKGPGATALMMNTGHLLEHYGNLVTYFRIKGMVPPTSRRAP